MELEAEVDGEPGAPPIKQLLCTQSVRERGGLVAHTLTLKTDTNRDPVGEVAVSGTLEGRGGAQGYDPVGAVAVSGTWAVCVWGGAGA